MPFRSIARPEHDLVITAPYGLITDDELPAYYRDRLASGSLRPGLRELVDARAIEQFEVTARGQARLVAELQQDPSRVEGIRWAFIAPSPLAFGMFRMFQAQKGELPFETGVFTTPADAASWLGVPVEVIPDPDD